MGVASPTRQDERSLFEPTAEATDSSSALPQTPAPVVASTPDHANARDSADTGGDASTAPDASAPDTTPPDANTDAVDSVETEDAAPPDAASLTPTAIATVPQAPRARGPLIDAGWLFLIAGVVLIAFTVIIPAYNDLRDANFYRERMRLAEDHRELRLSRHLEYQAALARGDETLVRSLAAMQLNQAPADQELIKSEGDISTRTASPFGSLEPPPLVLPQKVEPPKSTLEKWATDDRSRLWLVAAGALLILVGLLPAARRA